MQVSFTPSPELFPFQSRWFEADGIRMHFVDEGGGRPILMCHGNPTWSFLYRKVIPRLRDHFRCVAVDFPGFGLSDRPEGTATRLPSTPRSWASSGITCNSRSSSSWARIGVAPIGMWDAAERADRIHGMIFMNTWFWPADRLRMQVFSRVMASPPLQWAILQRNLFVEGIIPRSVTHPLSPAEMDHYRGPQPTPAARRGVAEFPRQILAARPWLQRLAERAPNVLRDKPVLLICGRNNPAFGTQDVIDRWKTCFPSAEVVVQTAAGHYIQEDAPDEIAAAVIRRFGSKAPGTG